MQTLFNIGDVIMTKEGNKFMIYKINMEPYDDIIKITYTNLKGDLFVEEGINMDVLENNCKKIVNDISQVEMMCKVMIYDYKRIFNFMAKKVNDKSIKGGRIGFSTQ